MTQPLRVLLISLVGSLLALPFFMSPSVAQVNGPGISPSSTFDTVINLPGDEVIISGGLNESVGGVIASPVPTVQLNVGNGGTIGDGFNADFFSEVNISGGVVGNAFRANPSSEVNIIGGIVGLNFLANTSSVVNISGGTIGTSFYANSGSEVNISGGAFDIHFNAAFGSEVNISGGTFGDGFELDPGGRVNLIGSAFQINGSELDTLVPGEAFFITDRSVTLSGVLDSGDEFSFDLNPDDGLSFIDAFDPDGILTVTISVPEPSSAAIFLLAITLGLARRQR